MMDIQRCRCGLRPSLPDGPRVQPSAPCGIPGVSLSGKPPSANSVEIHGAHSTSSRGNTALDDEEEPIPAEPSGAGETVGPGCCLPRPNENAWLLGQAAMRDGSLAMSEDLGMVGARGLAPTNHPAVW